MPQESLSAALQARNDELQALILGLEGLSESEIASAQGNESLPERIKMADVELRKRWLDPTQHLSPIELIAGRVTGYIDVIEKVEAILLMEDPEQASEEAYKELAKLGYNADEFFQKSGLTLPQNRINPLIPEVPFEEIEAIIKMVSDTIVKSTLFKLTSPRTPFVEPGIPGKMRESAPPEFGEKPSRDALLVATLKIIQDTDQIRFATRSLIEKAASGLAYQRMPEPVKVKGREAREAQLRERQVLKMQLRDEAVDEITAATQEDPTYLRKTIQELIQANSL